MGMAVIRVKPISNSTRTNLNQFKEIEKQAEIKNPRHIIMKNLRHAIQGICPKCGTKMFKFGRG